MLTKAKSASRGRHRNPEDRMVGCFKNTEHLKLSAEHGPAHGQPRPGEDMKMLLRTPRGTCRAWSRPA
jgi:hypothetical protein